MFIKLYLKERLSDVMPGMFGTEVDFSEISMPAL
jgi:hypothetical protein